MSDIRPSSATGPHSLAFVLITVFIDTVGLGIIVPVLPDLILELTGEGLGAAARYGGWLMFVFASMQFVCAPVLGNLSDAVGRRPVLLLSLGALGADYLLMAWAPTLAWLFVGRVLSGGFAATHATANAYVADVTPAEGRARAFGLVGAVWGVGFTLGPMIGGLLGDLGSRAPFVAAAALALANAAYGLLVLPESLPPSRRRRFALARANPVGAFAALGRRSGFAVLFCSVMLYAVAHDANPAAWTYYTIERFGWTAREIGWSLGGVGVAIMVVQGGLVGPIVARLGEARAATIGFAVMALGFLGFAFASQGWMMYAYMVPFALGSVAMPALRSLMSDRVAADEQGELAGAIASIMSVMAIPAPLLMTRLFSAFTTDAAAVYFPGAPFALAGALCLVSAVTAAVGAVRAGRLAVSAGAPG
jgi:DHA1 family tetracycline resistance protein-like MFS transporter